MANTRYTINQLSKKKSPLYLSDLELLREIVKERKSHCSNYYSPLYIRLTGLQENLNAAILNGKQKV